MTWMLTATGATVDLRFIAEHTISLLDIAHHLSQINRFAGACSRPYSVAEHSLFVLDIIEHQMIACDPAVLMAALLHDAHEAYTNDLTQPMKQVVGPAWSMEENRIQRAVQKRFDIVTASASASKLIHWADMTALVTERKALMPDSGALWAVESTHEPVDYWDFKVGESDFGWKDWRDAFVEKFGELEYSRKNFALRMVKG